MNVIETLFGPILRGPMKTRTSQLTNQFAGFGTLSSGSAFVTVSTNMVRSGCIVQLQERIPGSLGVAVSSGGYLVVNSIVDNTSFNVARAKGDDVVYDTNFSWFLIETD